MPLASGSATGGNLAVSTSGELDLHGFSIGAGGLSGSGLIDNLSGSSTYTLTAGNGDANSTFAGTIRNTSGKIALAKTGAGTLVLSGSNTYGGGTTIAAGTLQLGDGANFNGYVAGNVSDAAMLSFADPATDL